MPKKKNGGESAGQFADRMNAKFGDKINPQELFQKVERFLGRFVCYPSEHAHVAHVLWVAHAHCMDAWESTPRLAALSPEPESGKTRLLETTSRQSTSRLHISLERLEAKTDCRQFCLMKLTRYLARKPKRTKKPAHC